MCRGRPYRCRRARVTERRQEVRKPQFNLFDVQRPLEWCAENESIAKLPDDCIILPNSTKKDSARYVLLQFRRTSLILPIDSSDDRSTTIQHGIDNSPAFGTRPIHRSGDASSRGQPCGIRNASPRRSPTAEDASPLRTSFSTAILRPGTRYTACLSPHVLWLHREVKRFFLETAGTTMTGTTTSSRRPISRSRAGSSRPRR